MKLPKYLLYSYIALFVANLIWSAATPVIKLTLEYVPLFTFLFIRFTIVCLVLLPYAIVELKKHPVDKRDIPNLILLGLFGQASIGLIFAGLKYATSLDANIIGIISPILAIAAGHYFYKEKVNIYVKLGVVFASVGTLFIVLEPVLTQTPMSTNIWLRVWGNILVVLYSLAFLVYIIWAKISLGQSNGIIKKTLHFIHLKPMHRQYPATLITATTFYVALAVFIPLALLENLGVFGPVNFMVQNLTLVPILGILYMALLSSIVAYMLFEWALKVSTIGDSAIFTYLSPIMTIPFAYLLLGEKLTAISLAGSLIIALGVVIAERRKT
ncbi:MAG TPA: DMT family transporter [Candidatus Saccharimonadales bacterium]|nr:DMT family transporter [Candidatus Saccharimonadales bacterium]